MKYHFIQASSNRKTGPIPQTYTSRESCPPSCAHYRADCYAEDFYTRLTWDKVPARGTDLEGLLTAINRLPKGQLWRHNVAGDLPGDGETIDPYALGQIVKANRGRKGFTYTHKPPTKTNLAAIANANAKGFTINLSANNLAHADTLAKTGLPVVVILPKDFGDNGVHHIVTAGNNSVVQCPATYRDNVTCKSCGLCALSKNREIVGFPAHGTGKNSVDRIARL